MIHTLQDILHASCLPDTDQIAEGNSRYKAEFLSPTEHLLGHLQHEGKALPVWPALAQPGDGMAHGRAGDHTADDRDQDSSLRHTLQKDLQAARPLVKFRIRDGHEGYAKINLFVNKTTLEPVRKEYFALSGITNKICNFKELVYDDKGTLSKLVMEFIEPIKQRTSTVTVDEGKIVADIPEKYFNENYLKFLGGE